MRVGNEYFWNIERMTPQQIAELREHVYVSFWRWFWAFRKKLIFFWPVFYALVLYWMFTDFDGLLNTGKGGLLVLMMPFIGPFALLWEYRD